MNEFLSGLLCGIVANILSDWLKTLEKKSH